MLGFARLHEQLGNLFLLFQPLPHRLADLHVKAELQGVYAGILSGRHPLRPCLAVYRLAHQGAYRLVYGLMGLHRWLLLLLGYFSYLEQAVIP